MRVMEMQLRGAIRSLLAVSLVVAAACGSGPSKVATTTASPAPTAVFDDSYGFLIGNTVRSESSSTPLFVLAIGNATGGVVSPDGRHLAYFVKNDLRVIDIKAGAQPRTLLTITGKGEGAMYLAWSSDNTGIVVGVGGPYPAAVADIPPSYTKLRVVDVAGGNVRDVIRVANASVIPLGWDRQAHLLSAYESTSAGAGAYDVVSETGTLKRAVARQGLFVLAGSPTGQHVLGRGDPNNAVRVWPLDSYANGVELSASTDEHVATVAWRPGTSEVGVLFHGDRLELWNANGARRTVTLPTAPETSDRYATISFRADGKGVVITRQSGDQFNPKMYAVAVDLASGRTAPFDWAGVVDGPPPSVRIG
jgi:WD40 repeat protein